MRLPRIFAPRLRAASSDCEWTASKSINFTLLTRSFSFEASMETLAQLRNEGKIRLIGLSNVTQEHIERARKIVPIVSVQNRYSFADREWDYVVDYCERTELRLFPGSLWGRAELRATCWSELRVRIKPHPCR